MALGGRRLAAPRRLARRLAPWLLWAAIGPAWGGAAAGLESPSLFRSLLGPTQAVPFPIDRLLARIRQELAPDAPFEGLPLVLIPLGRSLQRHAAGDAEYFLYPRVVVAVTGEPRDPAAPLLRDRLYLGYHEKAAVLEVISYNPGAGRFEFEVVDDYRAGGRPRLRAGNRSLCLACHQNEAPLFPRQTWDETSASRSIAALLALTGKDYYGLDWRRGVDVANAIDESTGRANLLSVAQRVWSDGCGATSSGADCRARLWWLALRSRFTGLPPDDAELADPALQPLRRWWAGLPEGLQIPNPDIPNRLPFAALPPEALGRLDADALRRAADVAARFDALAERPALEAWMPQAPGALGRVVAAVGGYLAETDTQALGAHLAKPGVAAGTERMTCDRRPREHREDLRCWVGQQLRLAGRLAGERLWVDRMVLPEGMVRYGLAFERRGADFVSQGPVARTRDGRAVHRLRFAGDEVEWHFTDDLAPLRRAVVGMAERSGPEAGRGFSAGVLDRQALLAPLYSGLGAPVPPKPAPLPPLEDGLSPSPAAALEALAPFYRRCASCHDATEAFPPGFLRGEAPRVQQRLDACATRIWQRLGMWAAGAAQRAKTPMPPPTSAQAIGFAGSTDLSQMQRFIEARLRALGLEPAQLETAAYADLPPCALY